MRLLPSLLRRFASRSLLVAAPIFGPIHCDVPPPDPSLAQAIVRADRSAHLLDRPYPSDELRAATGRVVLQGFPRIGPQIGQNFMGGWLAQVASTVNGFSSMTPIYFRFDRDPGLAPSHAGRADDPVRLFSLDSGDRVPLRTRFVADSLGDPYLPNGTLVVVPEETHPLRPGERYAAIVTRDVARPADGWSIPPGLERDPRALLQHAVATVFTVQSPAVQLDRLRAAADALLDAGPLPAIPPPALREVASLSYAPGVTASGQPATIETVSFVDGGTETTELNDSRFAARTIDLASGPYRVYQTRIATAAFQDPAGRPYQSPGVGIVFDFVRRDGWIDFGADDALRTLPHAEPMRVVVQVPRQPGPGGLRGVLRWGHGSGGDAYEAIERVDPANDLASLRARIAAAGAVIVSFDQPLFGQRFPLIDRGYEPTLAIVNVANLPAFRDGVRQGAVDAHVVTRFAREVLPALVPGLPASPPLAAFGHSIGAQIAGVALGLQRSDGLAGVFLNGTGGFQTHSVLASDLLRVQGSVGDLIFQLAGITPVPGARPPQILGALFGVPEAAWPAIDRHHPLSLPFQLVTEGADPLPVMPLSDARVQVMIGDGDGFVPPEGGAWLAGAARDGVSLPCAPSTPYDGHYCVFREEAGRAAFDALLSGL